MTDMELGLLITYGVGIVIGPIGILASELNGDEARQAVGFLLIWPLGLGILFAAMVARLIFVGTRYLVLGITAAAVWTAGTVREILTTMLE